MRKFFPTAIFLILIGVFFIWQGIYLPKGSDEKERIFEIKKGDGLLQIAKNLEKEGLIKSKIFFDLYIALGGNQGKLQAGFYSLDSSMSAKRIARKIIAGDIAGMTVTIPEGFAQKQIEERLGFDLPGENLEGFLFPDTYEFPVGVTGEEVVKIMKDNLAAKTAPYQEEISRAKLAFLDVITMASLIEKEVRTK
ncbi:MAG: endolytic transglycosylase MltG, partial [bacterium]|nr:endolytic transglycosylase MltG [bacterium]